MDYAMTGNELIQAIYRIRACLANTNKPVDAALMPALLKAATVPGLDEYVLWDLTLQEAARLDWALER